MTSLNAFLDTFEIDEGCEPIASGAIAHTQLSNGLDVLQLIGDRSFNLGTFRTFSIAESSAWTELICQFYPAFDGIIRCIGYGWDGKIVAETLANRQDIDAGVTILDPVSAEALNIPLGIVAFLNDVISDDDDVLDAATYLHWLTEGNPPVQYDECVGYDVPPFLGGSESRENMSLTDLEVYWTLTGQLIQAYNETDDGDEIVVT